MSLHFSPQSGRSETGLARGSSHSGWNGFRFRGRLVVQSVASVSGVASWPTVAARVLGVTAAF